MSPKPPSLEIVAQVHAAGLMGLAPQKLEALAPSLSRSTLNRRLASLVKSGAIQVLGAGRATYPAHLSHGPILTPTSTRPGSNGPQPFSMKRC